MGEPFGVGLGFFLVRLIQTRNIDEHDTLAVKLDLFLEYILGNAPAVQNARFVFAPSWVSKVDLPTPELPIVMMAVRFGADSARPDEMWRYNHGKAPDGYAAFYVTATFMHSTLCKKKGLLPATYMQA